MPALEEFIDKKVTGIFEEINYERDFKFYCFETKEMYENVHYVGIRMPIGKKDHIVKFKNFAAKNLYQRETCLVVRNIEGKDIFVIDAEVSNDESPLKNLLNKGFAKLDNDANNQMDSLEYLSYKAL